MSAFSCVARLSAQLCTHLQQALPYLGMTVSDDDCWWLGTSQARHRRRPELQNHTFQMHPRWVLCQAPDLSAASVPVLPGAGVLKTRSLSTAIQREILELLDRQAQICSTSEAQVAMWRSLTMHSHPRHMTAACLLNKSLVGTSDVSMVKMPKRMEGSPYMMSSKLAQPR